MKKPMVGGARKVAKSEERGSGDKKEMSGAGIVRTEPDGNEEAHRRRRNKGSEGRAIVEKDDRVASLDCRKAVDEKSGRCGNGDSEVEKRGNEAGLFART